MPKKQKVQKNMVNPQKQDGEIWKVRGVKEITKEEINDGGRITKISAEEVGKRGNIGVRIQTAKKTPFFRKHRPGIWLSHEIDISAWLKWLLSFIKRVSLRVWGEETDVLKEEIDFYKAEIEELTKNLSETKENLEKLKLSLREKERQKMLAEKAVDNIEKYNSALDELTVIIKESVEGNKRKEGEIKRKIRENRWLLGLDCEIGASEKNIDTQTSLDLHIITDLNQDKIFEFKSPNLKPFAGDFEQPRLKINSELAQGMNQLIQYLRRTDFYSQISGEGTYKIQGPSGVIVIGYDLDSRGKRLLKDWNFHLRPHIYLMTYNDLLINAKRQIDNIKKVRQEYKKQKVEN